MAIKTINVRSLYSCRDEALASGTVTPGFLLERTSASALTVKAHSGAGLAAQKLFAVENDLVGAEIDDDYASGAIVQMDHMLPGDRVLALLSNGENAAIGDFLVSDGAGALAVFAADSAGIVSSDASIVAVAVEAVDMSDSSGADPTGRILVEIV